MPVSNGTILIVEDDAPVPGLFVRALTGAGYRVLEARNGEEAIKMFADHGADVDLLITDMRMPYVGGAELIQELRRSRSPLKVLCISAYPGLHDGRCDEFLQKPFTNAEFPQQGA